MSRKYYDNERYWEERAKLRPVDGKHCIICGATLPRGRIKYCSNECVKNWYETKVKPYRKDWQRVRLQVLKRDNYTCQDCGRRLVHGGDYGSRPEVHHIVPVEDGGEEFNPDNCISLCHACHIRRHQEIRLRKWREKHGDLRAFVEGG